jgi:glycopeptide antibiotics resistance protein
MIIIILFILIWLCIAVFSVEAEHNKLPNKIVLISIIAIYITFVLYMTLLNRKIGKSIDYKLDLFWSYKEMLRVSEKYYFKEIVLNIALFVPFGFLLPMMFEKLTSIKTILLLAFIFSLFIETSQLVFKIGLFELDDLFDNTLGAVIGYGIIYSLASLVSNKKEKVKGFVLGLMPFMVASMFFLTIFFIKN